MTTQQIWASDESTLRFEPIVDLQLARVSGYDIQPVASAELRQRAVERGTLAEQEIAWRREALERVVQAALDSRATLLMGVDHRILQDPAFRPGTTRDLLAGSGLAPDRMAIRLSVPDSAGALLSTRALVRHYASQGFPIALDAACADSPSLQAVQCFNPDIVLLGDEMARGISEQPLRWNVLSAFATFCELSGKTLVANGLDTWADVMAAQRAGVRFGRGFVLGRPAASPAPLDPATRALLGHSRRNSALGEVGSGSKDIEPGRAA